MTTRGRRQPTPSPAAKAGREVRDERGESGGCHLPDHRRTPATKTFAAGEAEREGKEAMARRGGRGGRRPTPSPAARRGARPQGLWRSGEGGDGGDGDWEAVVWSMREREFRTTRHLSMRERPTS
jgi:hypothetical protein